MRVIELRDRARFTVEALAELRITGECLRQDLDRDGAIQPRVAGFVDLAHAAGAERREDFIGAEARAGGQTHFFNPAVQFSTTVIGVGTGSPLWVLMRKRRPSRLGT